MADRFMKVQRATASEQFGDLPVGRVVRVDEATANRWKDLGIAKDASEREFDASQETYFAGVEAGRTQRLAVATGAETRGRFPDGAEDLDNLLLRNPLLQAEMERRVRENVAALTAQPQTEPPAEGKEATSSGRSR